MRLLSTLEDRLESVVSRLFSRHGNCRLHPVEIAQALVRAMERKQSVSIDKIYVPNVFRISLHPQDLASLEPIRKTIERDVIQYCMEVARKRGYDFAGPISLVFTDDQERAIGSVKVDVSFLESLDDTARRPMETSRSRHDNDKTSFNDIGQQTERYPVRYREEDKTIAVPTVNSTGLILKVVDGPDKGKSVVLSEAQEMVIGRSNQCQFVLSDGQVSKVHAKIWHNGTRWWIQDLNSTNGTFRNGQSLKDEPLDVGDELTLGMTTLHLLQEELP